MAEPEAAAIKPILVAQFPLALISIKKTSFFLFFLEISMNF